MIEEIETDSDFEYTKGNNGEGQFCPADDIEALEVIVQQFSNFLEMTLGLSHTYIKKKLYKLTTKLVKSAQKEFDILKNQRPSSENSLTFDYQNYEDFVSNYVNYEPDVQIV